MGVPTPGMFTRDLFQLSCLLDKFSTLGRPVFLTAVGAPGPQRRRPERRVRRPARPRAGRALAPAVGPAAPGRVDGGGLPAGAEQAVRREHRLGQPGRHQPHAPRRRAARRHAQAQAGVQQAPGAAREVQAVPRRSKRRPTSAGDHAATHDRRAARRRGRAPQRGVAARRCWSCLLVYLAVRYACNPAYVSDPQPADPPRYDELADRIDPNTADWQTLAALPRHRREAGAGHRRVPRAIARREHPAQRRVRAAGRPAARSRASAPRCVETLRPYLHVPDDRSDRTCRDRLGCRARSASRL